MAYQTQIHIEMTANEIEQAAIERATKRAELASERKGRVRKGFKWVNGTVNAGVHKTAADFIDVAREDVLDAIKDLRAEQDEKERAAHVAAPTPTAPVGNSKRRYVTSLDRAEREGLNHGRAWTCGEIDIQTKGARPEWEGDLICYVYED